MDLSSLNLDNLDNIVASLSAEDMEKLNSLASELFSGGKSEKKSESKIESSPSGKADSLFSGLDPEMLMKITNIMSKLNSAPKDPRCDFISSLKPLLGKDKQQKADEAIKMLQLLSLIPMLNDFSQGNNGT